MSMPVQQVVQDMQQAQIQRRQSQRVMNGLQAGVDLLEDKTVVAPIIMHEGLTDLKWILQSLLNGQFSLNLDPKRDEVKSPEGRPETGPEGGRENPE